MAATPAQHQHSHLPPSPPPSPPMARPRRKKPADPFLDLGDATTPSPPSSPSHEQAEQETLLTRIILTPLLFISFLLSLFLVNRSDRARRTSTHRTTFPANLLAYFSPTAWLDPEPYQDPSSATWSRRDSASHVSPHAAISPREGGGGKEDGRNAEGKRRPWFFRKKIRRMARLEVGDALEMRGKVMVVVLAVMGWALVGVAWLLAWLWGWVRGRG